MNSGERAGTTLSTSLAEKLTALSRSSKQPSSTVGMVKDAAVDSAKGAGCYCGGPQCRVLYVQQFKLRVSGIDDV